VAALELILTHMLPTRMNIQVTCASCPPPSSSSITEDVVCTQNLQRGPMPIVQLILLVTSLCSVWRPEAFPQTMVYRRTCRKPLRCNPEWPQHLLSRQWLARLLIQNPSWFQLTWSSAFPQHGHPLKPKATETATAAVRPSATAAAVVETVALATEILKSCLWCCCCCCRC